MANMTITEGLAEIKTIGKRVEKKQSFIQQHVARLEKVRDPLAKQGGSEQVVAQERQAIDDLLDRIVQIRSAVNTANVKTELTLHGTTRSIANWLVWRREVAPTEQHLLQNLASKVSQTREQNTRRGVTVWSPGQTPPEGQEVKEDDVIVSVDELKLSKELESVEQILGDLDGKLSLLNATTTIEVEPLEEAA